MRNVDVDAMGPLQWSLLLLWAPIGLPLMVIRAGLTIAASLLVPPLYRAWWVTFLAGMFLKVENKAKLRDHGAVVVSNHLSYFDRMTVASAVRSHVPLATLIWHRVNWLNRYMARPTVDVLESGRNQRLKDDIQEYLAHGNVLLFPEATITDGGGMLRFEKMAFMLEARVWLVAIRYRRALPFVAPSALRELQFVQLFYDLFQPWTVAEMIVLGTHEPEPGETPQESSVRAQQRIAQALDIPATHYTWRDRRRLLAEHGRDRSDKHKAKRKA